VRAERRAKQAGIVVGLAATLAACQPIARLTRPEGDGGWSAARRHEELAARAEAAVVALDEPETLPAAGESLTLDAALALSRTKSRRIAEAERQVAMARERVWDSRGRLLPSTIGSGRYTWYTDAQTTGVSLPPGLLPAGTLPPEVTVRESQFGVVNGTVAMPLDVSGELTHALASAQAGYRGERARAWATTLDEQVRVIRAYFDLLEAERLSEVTEQTLASERQQLQNAQSRYDGGRLTKNDLLVVQVAVVNSEHRREQRQLEIDRARWALNDAIGLAIDAPTKVADVRARPATPAAADALRTAYQTNPVLASLIEEQQRLEDTATALARSRFPRFSAGGAVDYSSAEIVQPQTVGSGFVGFSWDLGTDGRREAQIAEARIAADKNRLAVERELRALEAAVRSAQRAVEERLGAYAAAETAVGQAEENLRIRRQQFDAGRATSDDVLQADAILAQQRATLASALYQAHARRAELQQLMGLPVEDIVPQEP
jgi:outer membrane protein